MTENIQDTLKERGSKHGDFSDNSRIAQCLKAELAAQPNWERMKHYQREALEMICHKIARIMAGDFDYDDHYRDIAGYAQLVVNLLNAPKAESFAQLLADTIAAKPPTCLECGIPDNNLRKGLCFKCAGKAFNERVASESNFASHQKDHPRGSV